MLEVELAGLKMANPLILASGIMGTTPGGLNRVAREGAGGVTTKSLGPEPREGHPAPNVVKVTAGYLNAMGLPNPGVEEFASELKEVELEAAVFGSIFAHNDDEFRRVARVLEPTVDALELNLSCPHAESLGAAIGARPPLVEEIVSAVVREVNIPVFAKLTPNVSDITEIGRAAELAGADGVVAINTLPGMSIDVGTRRPILGNKSGGLSGPAIHPVAVKSVYDLYEALSIPIIGAGGIESGEDLVETLLAGANACQVGTAIADTGMSVFRELNSWLADYLDSHQMGLSELIGAAHDY
ncbi:dihydroorotate dehydrogenase [Candidatus Bipolaricaulota bacterium]|nr:dihydroorotate dehydrogenase [Candidatus Bipolaricaulota bacterium]MBS3792086.1 dihydroorotate dehydrogenase [Candidatus Bipolaricaulota bacterium]